MLNSVVLLVGLVCRRGGEEVLRHPFVHKACDLSMSFMIDVAIALSSYSLATLVRISGSDNGGTDGRK